LPLATWCRGFADISTSPITGSGSPRAKHNPGSIYPEERLRRELEPSSGSVIWDWRLSEALVIPAKACPEPAPSLPRGRESMSKAMDHRLRGGDAAAGFSSVLSRGSAGPAPAGPALSAKPGRFPESPFRSSIAGGGRGSGRIMRSCVTNSYSLPVTDRALYSGLSSPGSANSRKRWRVGSCEPQCHAHCPDLR
jgi:hypothetical protein